MHSALYLKLILVNLFKIRMAFANCTNVTTIIVLIVSCVFGYVMYLPKKYVILRILLFKGIHLTLYSSIMKITLFFGGIYLEYVHTATRRFSTKDTPDQTRFSRIYLCTMLSVFIHVSIKDIHRA